MTDRDVDRLARRLYPRLRDHLRGGVRGSTASDWAGQRRRHEGLGARHDGRFRVLPPTTVHFSVVIDGSHDLEVFTACDGRGCEMVIEQREEGSNNAYIHQFAVAIKFSNVKLTRPINRDSAKVAAWFADLAVHKVDRPGATIAALDPEGAAIATWKLQEASLSVGRARPSTSTAPRSPPRPWRSPTTGSGPERPLHEGAAHPQPDHITIPAVQQGQASKGSTSTPSRSSSTPRSTRSRSRRRGTTGPRPAPTARRCPSSRGPTAPS